jgi:hypothetical protein
MPEPRASVPASTATRALRASLLLPLALAACGDGETVLHLDVPAECNPLGGEGCALPWPSSIYEVADEASPTGIRLAVPLGALPGNADGIEIDVAPINARSGFSPLANIIITFPGGVDGDLPSWDDLGASLEPGSATVIIDAETGARVAHFAEVDANITSGDFSDQALYLRPAARLRGNTRYVVGITKALKARGGGELARPAAFQALVDGTITDHALLEAMRPRFHEVLANLNADGVATEDLVVAWDFKTADDESLIVDARSARGAALDAAGPEAEEVTYAITLDESPDSRDAGLSRRIHLDVEFPKIADENGFFRDGDGNVEARGTITEPVIIMVPACATPANPASIVIFGHGFFGDLSESEGSYMRRYAKDTCSVVVGGLWRGMSIDDQAAATLTLNDINRARPFAEHTWQGIADFMNLTALAKFRLPTELLVDDPAAKAPQSIVDPARVEYYGISQGGILGATLFPWDPNLEKAALHVGGANWAMLFERSTKWAIYGEPLKGAYDGELPSVIMQQVLTMAFEIIDGATIAPWALDGSLAEGLPPKQIIQHMSVGDALVANLTSLYWTRSAGLPSLESASTYAPFGIEPAADGVGSALIIMDESPSPLPPTSNLLNAADNEAHENIRRRTATVDQLIEFFAEGTISNTCDGVCDCAAGSCGIIP